MQANPVGLEVRRDSRSRKVTCRGNLIFDKMDHGHNRLAGSLLAFPSKLVAIDVICKKCIERKVSQETFKSFPLLVVEMLLEAKSKMKPSNSRTHHPWFAWLG